MTDDQARYNLIAVRLNDDEIALLDLIAARLGGAKQLPRADTVRQLMALFAEREGIKVPERLLSEST
jgi:hypothetical protein